MKPSTYLCKSQHITPWITPAVVLALFVWLRSNIRDLRREMHEMRRDLDARLRAVETGLAELRGRFDGIDGQLAFLRDYITGENVRGQRSPAADADE